MEFQNEYKVCPICKANVFVDMDTCYKCMHKFDKEHLNAADLAIPEVFSQNEQEGIFPEGVPAYGGNACSREGNYADAANGSCPSNSSCDTPTEPLINEEAFNKNMAPFIGAMRTTNDESSQNQLFSLFLVEFERFLSGFIADRVVNP